MAGLRALGIVEAGEIDVGWRHFAALELPGAKRVRVVQGKEGLSLSTSARDRGDGSGAEGTRGRQCR